ncbi:GNAT family N-acetyltransferase [Radiobacillus sp. PE A8.2]|uniref:GNAT family N-acetyltransferase n=1 Tax=Radiobacillus sp. PE A8.2 TaxID=3380349 RepID=UPI0038900E92
MIKEIDITNPELAQQVLRVQVPSYMVEAKIINFYDIPPLHDTVESLQKCEETFYGYYIDSVLCGAISFKNENRILDIHRLIVEPTHFRKGIASKLLEHLEQSVKDFDIITVSTGALNHPAIQFYETHGFTQIDVRTITKGLSLAFFEQRIR